MRGATHMQQVDKPVDQIVLVGRLDPDPVHHGARRRRGNLGRQLGYEGRRGMQCDAEHAIGRRRIEGLGRFERAAKVAKDWGDLVGQ